jgi:hypothetical protein
MISRPHKTAAKVATEAHGCSPQGAEVQFRFIMKLAVPAKVVPQVVLHGRSPGFSIDLDAPRFRSG